MTASSLVCSTRISIVLSGAEMRVCPAALALASSRAPSQAQASLMRARIGTAFSPMPPVKTSASSPLRSAAAAPIWWQQLSTKRSTARRASGSSLASRLRMSLVFAETPFSPEPWNRRSRTSATGNPISSIM